MSPRALRGLAVTGGAAAGVAAVVRSQGPLAPSGPGGQSEVKRALSAFAHVAEQLSQWAELARRNGWQEDAEILDASYLIAVDPVLLEQISEKAYGVTAEVAVQEAINYHAATIEDLADSDFAVRSSDVRELGNRVLRLLSGTKMLSLPRRAVVVLASDLGPADIAELRLSAGRVRGLALARGATTSHVAIMVRAMGLPFVVGLGDKLLAGTDGQEVFLDGTEGIVVIAPGAELLQRGKLDMRRRERLHQRLAEGRRAAAVTTDGKHIKMLCNASTPLEVSEGLASGAEGVGLVRTELAFLDASAWPSEAEHRAMLQPILERLEGRVATVRTLDFGHDKTPPFLRSGKADGARGIGLALAWPEFAAAQLRAILAAGRRTQLRILLPFVEEAAEVEAVRTLLGAAAEAVGWSEPLLQLGAMIETPHAVELADEIVACVDFVSIGTNDLVQYALDLDRGLPLAVLESAADPRVLKLVARAIAAAKALGVPVGICGEAASEPAVAALFLGLGVDELSVVPSRLDVIRQVVRLISADEAAVAAHAALDVGSTQEAVALGRSVLGGLEGV